MVGALTKAEKNSIGLCVEILIWAWEIQNTQSIYVAEEASGHQGSNYFRISNIFSYNFLFPTLPPFVHPLPISPFAPKAISLLYVFVAPDFLPLSDGKQENIWGDPGVINTNY